MKLVKGLLVICGIMSNKQSINNRLIIDMCCCRSWYFGEAKFSLKGARGKSTLHIGEWLWRFQSILIYIYIYIHESMFGIALGMLLKNMKLWSE